MFKTYPWYTPYQFAGNKPIFAIDLDGLEEKIVIMHTTQSGKVRREVYDFRKLLKTVDYVGVKNSGLSDPISEQDFKNIKKQLWDAYSGLPSLFASGYESYTIGGMADSKYKNTGFTAMLEGTLTITSANETIITYDRTPVTEKKISTMSIISDSTDKKKNPEMVKGINTAKNYVAGVSAVVSAPAVASGVVTGEATLLDVASFTSDIDQLTNASSKLTENSPNTSRTVNVMKVILDVFSIKKNIDDVLKFNNIKTTNATSTFPETISGSLNTTGDLQELQRD